MSRWNSRNPAMWLLLGAGGFFVFIQRQVKSLPHDYPISSLDMLFFLTSNTLNVTLNLFYGKFQNVSVYFNIQTQTKLVSIDQLTRNYCLQSLCSYSTKIIVSLFCKHYFCWVLNSPAEVCPCCKNLFTLSLDYHLWPSKTLGTVFPIISL